MRIKITYENVEGKEIFVPNHYNYVIQSLIYNTLSQVLASKLHSEGFLYEKRKFKLFTFSRILEKGEKSKDKLIFKNGLSFYFSSPVEEIVIDLAERGIKGKEFSLQNQRIFISKIEVLPTPQFKDKMIIKMVSPLTMHSTLKTADNKKKNFYYKPNDTDFSSLIENNAKKKYSLIHNKSENSFTLSIKPYMFSVKRNLSVIMFKNTPIEGYTGIFELSGSKELIKTTYDAGLGDRNPEGFGMWEVWRGERT